MLEKNDSGFGYYFINIHGPYSQTLSEDLRAFAQFNVIKLEKNVIGTRIIPSQKCYGLFENFGPISLRNRTFLKTIIEVNRRYAGLEFNKLLHFVHRMHSPLASREGAVKSRTIASCPFRAPLLKPIPSGLASKGFILMSSEIPNIESYIKKET